MKIKLLIAMVALVAMTGSALAQQTNLGVVSIDNTTNEHSATQLLAGSTHLISIRYDLSNNASDNYWVGSNGFEIYSPDGADWIYLQGGTGPLVENARTRDTDPFPTQLSRFRKHFDATDRIAANWVQTDNFGFDPAGGSQGPASGAAFFLATLSVPVPGESVLGGYLYGENDIAVTLEFQTLLADHDLTMCVDSNTDITAWEWVSAGVPDDYAQWDNGLGISGPRCWDIYDPDAPIISNLVLTEDTLQFEAIEGLGNPPPQTISVLSDRDPLAFDLLEEVSWLLKSPSSGVTPQEVEFSVTTTGLSAATYFDSVEVVSEGAANSPRYVFVELALAPPLPVISVDRDAFFFNALAGGDDPADQVLNISNIGQSTLNWVVTNLRSWLTLNPTSGTNSGAVTLSVSSAGLAFGEYHDTVTVADPAATNSPVLVPVRLSVASDLPVIEVDSVTNYWSVDWDVEGPMFTRSFTVRNGGAGALDFWVEKDDGFIINVSPASGTAPQEITLLFYMPSPPDPPAEIPLTILESLRIYSNEAINSPTEVACWFRFPLVPAVLHVEPTAMEFDVWECSQGYLQPMPSEALDVTNLGGDDPMTVDLVFESELFEIAGLEAPQDAPAAYTVTALRPDLPYGTYLDTIWVTSQWATNKPQLVEVTLNYRQTSAPLVIALSTGSLAIPYREESGPQIVNDLVIGNLNPGCMAWEIVEAVDWLTPVTSVGGVPDASPLLIDPVGYTLGEYPDVLQIIAPGAANSPAEVGVTLQVWKLRGDVNWNGNITAQDIALLIDYVFDHENPPQPALFVGDVNCDELVDVADIALLIEYLFVTLEPLCGNSY